LFDGVRNQQEPNRWQGFWTYDAGTVDRIDQYLTTSF
jgi:hypothetical protein